MLRRASLVSVLFLLFVACSSVPDLRFEEDAINPEGGTDSGRDTSPTDGGGGTDTSPVCVKTGNVEICDDDIDNDCNGLKDCADPACGAGFACATTAPDGWTLVAFVEASPPACPTGFTNPTDLRVLNGLAAHACPCTCDGSGGATATCAGGTSVVGVDDENTCTGAATRNVNANIVACTALPTSVAIPGGANTPFTTLTVPVGPTTCTPNATITKKDPTDGRTCVPPVKTGTGCTGTNRCLPKPTGYALCISKDGDQVCPTGFTLKRRAGTTSNDSRSCLACACGAATPCTGEVTLWSSATCTVKSAKLTGSACATPQGDSNFNATHYKSVATGGCGAATGNTPQGELTFGGERTVCCK